MADMSRYLKQWLTNEVLLSLGGEFEGVIAEVTEEVLRSPFSAQRTSHVVVTFLEGGYRLVLNKTNLKAMLLWFGNESENWTGRRVWVHLRPMHTSTQGGGVGRRFQRVLSCEDVHARYASTVVRR